MRSLSLLLGYSILAAGLYWESSSKPAIDLKHDGTLIHAAALNAVHINAKKAQVSKKKTNAAPPTTELQYLTSGAWKMQSVISDKPCDTNGDGVRTTDILGEMPSCSKDDVLFVRKNGRAVFQRGVPCDNEPSTQSYSWTLSGNGLFTMTSGSIVAEMQLVSVDAHTLRMMIPMEDGEERYRFVVTYTH